MPAAKPPDFRRRALDLVRLGEQPVAKIAKDLGISESCLRRWMDQDDVDSGRKEGLTSEERAELVRLRRENRVQAMEIEILKRASAYLPGRTTSQNDLPGGPRPRRRRCRCGGGLPGVGRVPLGFLRLAPSTGPALSQSGS